MSEPLHNTTLGFSGLGIAANFLKILENLKFTVPTPIQHQAIPIAIEGKDIIGVAQTGTGKTLAFGVPMIQRLAKLKGRGLVLLPTRELALQVEDVLHKIGTTLGLRTVVLIGGTPIQPQLRGLRAKPHIVIATPGRLLDHVEQKSLRLSEMTIVVLDEADRMLDMGFAPQIKKILAALPRERQVMLFSATMPSEIVRLATQFMKLPLQIEVAPAGTLADRIEQELFMVKKEDRLRLLDTLLAQYKGTVLIFSRTKHGAKKICRSINDMGHKAAELHSNRSLVQRKEAMAGFKSGKYRVLVATDIAARGIDVSDIELVVNFDIPDDPEDYVHRIGRTGRAGQTGRAISFVAPDQRGKVRDIERLTRTTIALKQPPELAPVRQANTFRRSGPPQRTDTRGGFGSRPGFSRGPQRSQSKFSGQRRERPGQREFEKKDERSGQERAARHTDSRSSFGSSRPTFNRGPQSGSNRFPQGVTAYPGRRQFENKFEKKDTEPVESPDDRFFSRPERSRQNRDFRRGNRRSTGGNRQTGHRRSF